MIVSETQYLLCCIVGRELMFVFSEIRLSPTLPIELLCMVCTPSPPQCTPLPNVWVCNLLMSLNNSDFYPLPLPANCPHLSGEAHVVVLTVLCYRCIHGIWNKIKNSYSWSSWSILWPVPLRASVRSRTGHWPLDHWPYGIAIAARHCCAAASKCQVR